jgi:hypothetical protein
MGLLRAVQGVAQSVTLAHLLVHLGVRLLWRCHLHRNCAAHPHLGRRKPAARVGRRALSSLPLACNALVIEICADLARHLVEEQERLWPGVLQTLGQHVQ